MRMLRPLLAIIAVGIAGILTGCATTSTKSPDVTAAIRTSLDQAGLKDVVVSQDREKGVVTLAGRVAAEGDKMQAGSIAQSIAGTQVVANQIAVVPADGASDAKQVNSDLDKGIESNLNAALIQAKLDDGVKFNVKNHVVTLSGEVNSQAKRALVEKTAAGVPNVQQVVNELQVKGQKATSSKE